MKTLFTVLAAIAVTSLGAVGGADYASQGKIGLLPSCVTGHCQQSDDSGVCCPAENAGDSSTAYCPDCGEKDPGSCPSCCKKTRTKTNGKQSAKK
jgi:hypothetical protein